MTTHRLIRYAGNRYTVWSIPGGETTKMSKAAAQRLLATLRGEPTTTRWNFRDKRGRFRACRLAHLDEFYDDPMTTASGCGGEIENDWRKRDLREGCPRCLAEVIENASEPDVLARWELR